MYDRERIPLEEMIPKIDDVWESYSATIEGKLREKLVGFFTAKAKSALAAKGEHVRDEDIVLNGERLGNIDKRVEAQLEKERRFLLRIYGKFVEVLRANPGKEIDILFDVDGTIGRPEFDYHSEKLIYRTEIRPALLPLLETMQVAAKALGTSVRNGLLTTRGVEDSTMRLNGEVAGDQLAEIRSYVDQELVYSSDSASRSVVKYYDDRSATHSPEYTHSVLSKKEKAYRPSVGEADKLHALQLALGDQLPEVSDEDKSRRARIIRAYKKLQSSENLAKIDLNSSCVIVVDDYRYAEHLDESRGIYGVSVEHEKALVPDERD